VFFKSNVVWTSAVKPVRHLDKSFILKTGISYHHPYVTRWCKDLTLLVNYSYSLKNSNTYATLYVPIKSCCMNTNTIAGRMCRHILTVITAGWMWRIFLIPEDGGTMFQNFIFCVLYCMVSFIHFIYSCQNNDIGQVRKIL